MDTQQIANQLVEYCRSSQYEEAQRALYDTDAVSKEPEGSHNPTVQGLDAIMKKAQEWENMVEEVHGVEVSDPIVAGNFFAFTMKNDVTFKGMARMTVEEVCVFEVKDGKIVLEQFFYPPMN